MANKYRDLIVSGLKEYGDPNLTDSDLEATAWIGLQETHYYNNVLTGAQRNSIETTSIMRKTKLVKRVINYFILPLVVLVISCSKQPDDKVVNDILHTVITAHEGQYLLNANKVENLPFKTQVSINFLDHLYYGKRFNTDIDSIVTESDIQVWNEQIEEYKPAKWPASQVKNIRLAESTSEGVDHNSQMTNHKTEKWDRIISVSTPFFNDTSNKALIYVESYYSLGSDLASSYVMILNKKGDGWKVVYKGVIWAS
jgi:hypothetical protein